MADTTQQFNEHLQAASAAVESLQAELAAFQTDAAKPKISASRSAKLGGGISEKLGASLGEIEAALAAAAVLLPQLQQAPRQALPAEGIKTGDLVNRFRSLIDTIQRDARSPAREGEAGATLQNLEVEMKGFITLQQNEARITTPTLTRTTDPGLLSTIKLAFTAIPVVRSAGVETEAPVIK